MSKLSKTIIILINILTVFSIIVLIVGAMIHDPLHELDGLPFTSYLARARYSESEYLIVPLVIIDLLYFLYIKLRKRNVKPKTEFVTAERIMIIINILTAIASIITVSIRVYECPRTQSLPPSMEIIFLIPFVFVLAIIDSLYFLIVKLIRKRREKRNFNLTDQS